MAVLLETSVGDLVIDLDLEGSPVLCRNFLKLCKARYYTQSLIHHVHPNRFVVLGDPTGTGDGGTSFYGLLTAMTTNKKDSSSSVSRNESWVHNNEKRFLASSSGRRLTEAECREKGRVVAVELYGLQNTVGSQFLITTTSGPDKALDGYTHPKVALEKQEQQQQTSGFLSLGKVVEDESNLLDRWADCYCDKEGRPYADWRIRRALVAHDPFDDPRAMKTLLHQRGVEVVPPDETQTDKMNKKPLVVARSPSPVRPPEETVSSRIPIEEVDVNPDEDINPLQEQQFRQEIQQKEDKSRAVVLEILGDLPDADIQAPENVLFICKLNSITTDEDLQLILSRFDEKVSVEIVRDQETGQSLNYAFAEFTTPQQATQAYLKMNQALVDDRRIVVDFSQSVAKLWDRHRQRYRSKQQQQQHSKRAPLSGSHKRPRHV